MKNKSKLVSCFFLTLLSTYSLFAFASCKDPYEGFNRAMFNFNESLDTHLVRPVTEVYNAIIPKPLNAGIHNFFNNINTLPTIANDLIQFNLYQATSDIWRVAINTTFGIGGLFDVASRMGLPFYKNDFGLTLTKWGYTRTNYVVLPFWGPCTVRDTMGKPVDFLLSVYPYLEPEYVGYALYALGVVDRRAQALQYQSLYESAAVDRYVFIRNAYLQSRIFEIKQNQCLALKDRKMSINKNIN